MRKQLTIDNLKVKISQIVAATYQVALEEEMDGIYFFSAFTHKGHDSFRFKLKLWIDSENRVFGACECSRGRAGYRCEHMNKAFREIRGH